MWILRASLWKLVAWRYMISLREKRALTRMKLQEEVATFNASNGNKSLFIRSFNGTSFLKWFVVFYQRTTMILEIPYFTLPLVLRVLSTSMLLCFYVNTKIPIAIWKNISTKNACHFQEKLFCCQSKQSTFVIIMTFVSVTYLP